LAKPAPAKQNKQGTSKGQFQEFSDDDFFTPMAFRHLSAKLTIQLIYHRTLPRKQKIL